MSVTVFFSFRRCMGVLANTLDILGQDWISCGGLLLLFFWPAAWRGNHLARLMSLMMSSLVLMIGD